MSETVEAVPRGVCLVGFMGAGKTTVGRLLAQEMQWPFIDLDAHIALRQSRSISEIFQQSGESIFRSLEQAALAEVLQKLDCQPLVLSLGAGAFLQPENACKLRGLPLPIVFLDAPADELYDRCVLDGAARPLLRDRNQFRQLYDQRRGTYMEADRRVDTTGILPGEIASKIAKLLGHEE